MEVPKYQAWHKEQKKMYRVVALYMGDKEQAVTVKNEDTAFHTYPLTEVELRAYIGLPDRKGKDIYQGDVCLYSYEDNDNPWPWVVVWCSGRNEFLRMQPGWIFEDYRHTIKLAATATLESPEDYVDGEVIGNVYEHPHLNTLDETVFWQTVEKSSEDRMFWKELRAGLDALETIDEEPS